MSKSITLPYNSNLITNLGIIYRCKYTNAQALIYSSETVCYILISSMIIGNEVIALLKYDNQWYEYYLDHGGAIAKIARKKFANEIKEIEKALSELCKDEL